MSRRLANGRTRWLTRVGNHDNRNRGFASMDDDKQRKIAQKGGEAISQDREHMSQIGRKGGEASHGGGHHGGNRGGGNQGGRNA